MGRPMLTLDDQYYNDVKGISTDAMRGSMGAQQAARKAVTGAEIQERMNPYLEQVLGRQVEDTNERNRIEAARRAAQRGGMRAFGTRGAIGEAIARDLEQERLDTMTAGLRFQGFESAQNQVNTERNRDLSVGQGLSGLGLGAGNITTNLQQIGQRERELVNQFENDALRREAERFNLLSTAGGLQQGAMEGQIQDSISLYNELQGAPYNQASFGNQILTGQQGTVQTAPTGSNPFSQILGLGATIAGLGVSGGGTVGGNLISGMFANGGRVGALRMANGGSATLAAPSAGSSLMYATDAELAYLADNLQDPAYSGMVLAEMARREAGGDRVGMTQAEMGAVEGANTGKTESAFEDAVSLLQPSSPVAPAAASAPAMPAPTPVGRGPLADIAEALPPARPEPVAPAASAQPRGAIAAASAAATPSVQGAVESKPGMWQSLLTDLTTVDPLTGKSPLYSFGVNMLAASANPDPGRGLFGNVGLSLKAMDEERKARRQEILDARLKAAAIDAKSRSGNKATGLVARFTDGTTQSVLRDSDGDYVYRGGNKEYLADIQSGGEEVRVARPQELPASAVAQEAAIGASAEADVEKINKLEARIDALSDADLGIVGGARKSASSAVGMLGDLFTLAGIPTEQISAVQKKIGDPENLRTLEVLEDGIYEMIVSQRREARGRAPTTEDQKAIRKLVSLQGMTDAASVRARLSEIMDGLRGGAYKQMELSEIRGGLAGSGAAPDEQSDEVIELEPIIAE